MWWILLCLEIGRHLDKGKGSNLDGSAKLQKDIIWVKRQILRSYNWIRVFRKNERCDIQKEKGTVLETIKN